MSKSEYKKILAAKKDAKEALYKESYPDSNTKTPLLILFAPSTGKEKSVYHELLEGLKVLPMHVIVVADDEPADALKKPAGHFTWVNTESGRNDEKVLKYLQAADMALVFEEDHEMLRHIMDEGVVVIGNDISPMLENYQPNEETGNAFTYGSMNPWEIFRALVRAYETNRFPYDWEHIIRGIFKNV